jgi:hypothetical protein
MPDRRGCPMGVPTSIAPEHRVHHKEKSAEGVDKPSGALIQCDHPFDFIRDPHPCSPPSPPSSLPPPSAALRLRVTNVTRILGALTNSARALGSRRRAAEHYHHLLETEGPSGALSRLGALKSQPPSDTEVSYLLLRPHRLVGPGHGPLKARTRVRIPLGTPFAKIAALRASAVSRNRSSVG